MARSERPGGVARNVRTAMGGTVSTQLRNDVVEEVQREGHVREGRQRKVKFCQAAV